jgi:hypothetical protein
LAIVGGTIIEQNDFHILKGLGENALQALRKKTAIVVVGHNNGYLGHNG